MSRVSLAVSNTTRLLMPSLMAREAASPFLSFMVVGCVLRSSVLRLTSRVSLVVSTTTRLLVPSLIARETASHS